MRAWGDDMNGFKGRGGEEKGERMRVTREGRSRVLSMRARGMKCLKISQSVSVYPLSPLVKEGRQEGESGERERGRCVQT